jgi:hypothetical protein
MATASKDRAAMKEQRAQDAKLAMREYEAERLAVRAKTARLRALRLGARGRTRPNEESWLAPQLLLDSLESNCQQRSLSPLPCVASCISSVKLCEQSFQQQSLQASRQP